MNETLTKWMKVLVRAWVFRQIYRMSIFLPYFTPGLRKGFIWSFRRTEVSNFYYDLTPKNLVELAHFVSAVTKVELAKIIHFIDEVRNDNDLSQHIHSSLARDKSMKDSTMLLGRRIGWYAFVRATRPKIVVETGVHQGIGAVTLIRALEKNALDGFPGRYFGTDIDPQAGVLVSGNFLKTGQVLYGDSLASLERLDENIDLFVNDSDHSAEYERREYAKIHKKLTANGLILGDNSHATDSLVDYSLEVGKSFLFFREEPLDHWYPGAGIGVSFVQKK
jgi:predicted O-methyltransferase YrrM